MTYDTVKTMAVAAFLAGCTTSSTNPPPDSTDSPTTSGWAWRHDQQLPFDGLTRTYSLFAPTPGTWSMPSCPSRTEARDLPRVPPT
jgi:hypothetical protein